MKTYFSFLETVARAFLMVAGKSTPMPSAIRSVSSMDGLRSPLSTKLNMDSETPDF